MSVEIELQAIDSNHRYPFSVIKFNESTDVIQYPLLLVLLEH